MIAAICLEDRNGLLFNGRRLSRDRAQQENLMALCAGEPLWLASCSLPLFRWAGDQVRVFEVLPAASHGLFFFEDRLPPPEWASEIVLYRWNRDYPADIHFTWDLSVFTLAEITEFPGSSHPVITRNIYVRKERRP